MRGARLGGGPEVVGARGPRACGEPGAVSSLPWCTSLAVQKPVKPEGEPCRSPSGGATPTIVRTLCRFESGEGASAAVVARGPRPSSRQPSLTRNWSQTPSSPSASVPIPLCPNSGRGSCGHCVLQGRNTPGGGVATRRKRRRRRILLLLSCDRVQGNCAVPGNSVANPCGDCRSAVGLDVGYAPHNSAWKVLVY